jgi:hypothetical protein
MGRNQPQLYSRERKTSGVEKRLQWASKMAEYEGKVKRKARRRKGNVVVEDWNAGRRRRVSAQVWNTSRVRKQETNENDEVVNDEEALEESDEGECESEVELEDGDESDGNERGGESGGDKRNKGNEGEGGRGEFEREEKRKNEQETKSLEDEVNVNILFVDKVVDEVANEIMEPLVGLNEGESESGEELEEAGNKSDGDDLGGLDGEADDGNEGEGGFEKSETRKNEELYFFLDEHNLSEYLEKLVADGVECKEDLAYVTVQDLMGMGVAKIKARNAVAAFAANESD